MERRNRSSQTSKAPPDLGLFEPNRQSNSCRAATRTRTLQHHQHQQQQHDQQSDQLRSRQRNRYTPADLSLLLTYGFHPAIVRQIQSQDARIAELEAELESERQHNQDDRNCYIKKENKIKQKCREKISRLKEKLGDMRSVLEMLSKKNSELKNLLSQEKKQHSDNVTEMRRLLNQGEKQHSDNLNVLKIEQAKMREEINEFDLRIRNRLRIDQLREERNVSTIDRISNVPPTPSQSHSSESSSIQVSTSPQFSAATRFELRPRMRGRLKVWHVRVQPKKTEKTDSEVQVHEASTEGGEGTRTSIGDGTRPDIGTFNVGEKLWDIGTSNAGERPWDIGTPNVDGTLWDVSDMTGSSLPSRGTLLNQSLSEMMKHVVASDEDQRHNKPRPRSLSAVAQTVPTNSPRSHRPKGGSLKDFSPKDHLSQKL